jgi:glycosyltransferase involved in cell wall biosynthesis
MDDLSTTTDSATQPADWQIRRPTGPVVALIPAYNEERFIGSLVLAVQPYVDQVVVVDDGSRDHTVEIAQRAGVTVVRHQVNRGKAAAVNTGFNYIRQLNPSAVVMLDGDGQHRVEDIPIVLDPIVKGEADLVIGSRFLDVKSDIPAYRQIGQHGLTMVTNLASGLSVGDSQSGFRAFSAASLKYISFSQDGFSIESEMQFLAREHKLRVVEVPIHVIYEEPAKRSPFRHGMQVINGIMHLVGQTRPLLFFSASGLVLFVGGLGLGVYIIDIYRRSHDLAIGYGLITVLLCVVGMLLFFAGVILHSTRGMLLELRRGVFERLAVYSADVWHTAETESQEEIAFELGK